MKLLIVVAFAVGSVPAAAAFLPGSVPAAPVCPNTGLANVPVTFVTAKGRKAYTVERAASPAEQECGLMYRKKMPRHVGMIFPFDPPRPATFWMENTVLALDLVFVDPDNRVLSIAQGKPFSRDILDSRGVAAAVVELNLGEAKRIGLKPGDKVEVGTQP